MTPKQRKFATSYAKNGSAYRSALEAGYTEQYAKSMSGKLLDHPLVIAEIKRQRERLNERADKSATDVINEFSKIAFSDRVTFLKEDPLREGQFMYKSPNELTQEQRDIVESVKMYTAEIVVIGQEQKPQTYFRQEYTYVLSEKAKALEQMGRHFGIFDDKLRLSVSQNNPFKDVTPEQLAKLKESWIETMHDPNAIEGNYKVITNEK